MRSNILGASGLVVGICATMSCAESLAASPALAMISKTPSSMADCKDMESTVEFTSCAAYAKFSSSCFLSSLTICGVFANSSEGGAMRTYLLSFWC
uniref:Secreted protein n=1 Tax=Cannabis sativa TaxID=3483 RepID=A0A803RCJ2_CANSA